MVELPADFFAGIALFNEGDYYECHEVLEEVWNKQSGDAKQLTQGIIQLAVGLYHARRDNYVGALKLITRGIERIASVSELSVNIDLKQLLENGKQAQLAVQERRAPVQFLIKISN